MPPRRHSGSQIGVIPDQWRLIAEIEKTMIGWPAWSLPEPPPTSSQAPANRDRLYSSAAEPIQFVIALAARGGGGIEGARLRVKAWAYQREREVTATLEAPGRRAGTTIARVDAWPADPHVNTMRKAHARLSHVPALVDQHHVHRFSDNAILGYKAFEPPRNLPIAVPITTDIRSFRDFLRIVSVEFRIADLEDIPPPDTWRLLV